MEFKAGDFDRLREVFAGRGLLVTGDISSSVERLCCYSAYNFLMSSKKEKVVWVSTDDPHDKVVGIFAEYGYNIKPYLDRFYFVDLISLKSGAEVEDDGRKKYVQDPGNLTELALAVSEHIDSGKVGMVVIYFMNSLLIYNELRRTLEFIRVLVARAFERKFAFMGAYIEGEHDERARTAIRLSMDAIAKLEDDHIHVITAKNMDSFNFSFEKDRPRLMKAEKDFSREKMLE